MRSPGCPAGRLRQVTGGKHLPGRDRESSFPPVTAASDPWRGFPCVDTAHCNGWPTLSSVSGSSGRGLPPVRFPGASSNATRRTGRSAATSAAPAPPETAAPGARLSHPPDGEDGPAVGRFQVSSPRVGPPVEGPCAEPRRPAASGPCEEGTAERRRPRPDQPDRGPPSDVAGPDFPARGHRPLHLRVRRWPRSGPAGQPGGFADVLSSHCVVLLRLKERSREGEGGAGGSVSASGARSRTRTSRGAPHDAPRIGIVRAVDSGVFGIRT